MPIASVAAAAALVPRALRAAPRQRDATSAAAAPLPAAEAGRRALDADDCAWARACLAAPTLDARLAGRLRGELLPAKVRDLRAGMAQTLSSRGALGASAAAILGVAWAWGTYEELSPVQLRLTQAVALIGGLSVYTLGAELLARAPRRRPVAAAPEPERLTQAERAADKVAALGPLADRLNAARARMAPLPQRAPVTLPLASTPWLQRWTEGAAPAALAAAAADLDARRTRHHHVQACLHGVMAQAREANKKAHADVAVASAQGGLRAVALAAGALLGVLVIGALRAFSLLGMLLTSLATAAWAGALPQALRYLDATFTPKAAALAVDARRVEQRVEQASALHDEVRDAWDAQKDAERELGRRLARWAGVGAGQRGGGATVTLR